MLLAAGVVLVGGSVGCGDGGQRPVSVVGSTSIQPFAELLAEEYARAAPQKAVEVQGGGSTAGLQAVANNLADIGMCSRSLAADETGTFTPIVVARDGLAVVVHPGNPLRELSLAQIRDIFSGRRRDWREVGGAPGPIRPITREEGSGTRESFTHLVMGKERIARAALTQESNGAVRELVRGDAAAIGYMSLGLVDREIKALAIDGVEPTRENVLAGRYTLTRPFLFATKGRVSPAAQAFIDFVLSPAGQGLLETEGLVRVQ